MGDEAQLRAEAVLDSHPLDALICEKCGSEFLIPPPFEAGDKPVCINCNTVMDMSHYFPLTREQKVWVSERALELCRERHARPLHWNCVKHYREVIRFREAIFEIYEKQGEITLAQAVAMLVSFQAALGEGVLELLGKGHRSAKRLDGWPGGSQPDEHVLFDWLAGVEIKTQRAGRHPRSDTLVLLLDALVLMFCPNAYTHFLRDALSLRAREYRPRRNDAKARGDASNKLWKAKGSVEVSCKRIWKAIYGTNPHPPSPDWWERVALRERIMGQSASTAEKVC